MNLRSIGTRTIAAVGAVGAVAGLTAAVAGAQTAPGRGPFASGMLTSMSGSALELQRTNPQAQSDATSVSVTLTGSTTYQKIQDTSSGAIVQGACVRVAGKGSVAKGKITASTVAITPMSPSGDCARPGGANGASPGSGPGTTFTVPTGGSTPNRPTRPGGNGRRTGGFAFGSVQSVNGQNVVVKATAFARRRQSGGSQMPPKVTTKKVKVALSGSTKVTELVPAAQTDLATGLCVSAAGTGDSQAITADRVTISQPDNGSCMGFGFAGGGGGGPGAVT
jgi:hypothetical protein